MYAKIFASIYQGTLRGNTNGLVVFTNMLAHADSAGWVDIHPRAISEETGLPIEKVREAIAELSAPDPESRSPEEEGRRIVLLDDHGIGAGGWSTTGNTGRSRARKTVAKRTRRPSNGTATSSRSQHGVSTRNNASAQSAQAEAEAEAEADTNTKKTAPRKRSAARFRRESCTRFARPEYPVDCRMAPSPQGQEGTVDATALDDIVRSRQECRIDPAEAILHTVAKNSWVGFNASWLEPKPNGGAAKNTGKHNFSTMDYTKGVNEDGTF